ncbi:thrombospondin type 3 repeat-containing protein [Chryseobacterium zhengzhouense]|uniref:Thrombospondin type 3 repeat-containing protein n=1 Tax=Chryseobacterium zhengzhouense TaxID=1636086 RepID=A0ABW2LZH3_9FLAO
MKKLIQIVIVLLFNLHYAQTVFLEDFGTSLSPNTTNDYGRKTSPYVPTASFNYGTSKAHSNSYTDTNIDNSYYAVVAPEFIYSGVVPGYYFWTLPDPSTPPFEGANRYTEDHTAGDTHGAVLAINAQAPNTAFYERNFSFAADSYYEVSFWIYVVNQTTQTRLSIKDPVSGSELGGVSTGAITTPSSDWQEYKLTFKTPAGSCNNTVATLSLQNIFTGGNGNDYYIDDIVVRKLTSQPSIIDFTFTCPANSISIDSDSDGIGNDVDLDSDNDGILDIYECPDLVVNTDFNSSNGNTVTFMAPAADLGFIFDVYSLDNSFNLKINGVNLAVNEIEFQYDQTDNIRFADGSRYGLGGVPHIYSMTGNASNPLVRVIIHKNGSVEMFGSKSSNGHLYPLKLYNGNYFNTINWNRTGSNTVVLSQSVVGVTYITGNGRGVKNGFCDPDGDGISNQFDTDSDGDGCPDAIEGSEFVKYEQVHALNLPMSDPNYNYRGQIKVLADGITTGSPVQVVSKTAQSNGVPELVNPASENTSGNNGIADNTDQVPTSEVGQGIGSSQDFTINGCICYNPANITGTPRLTTQHGITSLNRAENSTDKWPIVRTGAWTALESKTKGFVPNRLTTSQIKSIPETELREGMMVYNITDDCLQINTTGTATGWKCFTTQTCPTIN